MKILVFCEQREGKLKPSCIEALSLSYQLADESSVELASIVIGDGITDANQLLGQYGAKKVYQVDHQDLALYNPINYLKAFEDVVKEFNPDTILGIASPMGRDLFPRLAARLDAGLLTDITAINVTENGFVGGTKPMYAGKVLAQVGYTDHCKIKMATLRPNVFSAQKKDVATEVINKDFSSPEESKIKTIEITKGKSEKADLTEAVRIISGGRSLGSADNFNILHECAEVLGATVGASRAAVDAGYAMHSMQVGQTGKTVNPSLYIACGISGAIQHMAGMKTSKVIVAVNTDKDAPIFSIADYGIVGDLFEVVPLLTKKFKEMNIQ